MSRFRRLVLVAGVLALAGGLAAAVHPPLAATLGADDTLLSMLGVLALLLAARVVQQRRAAELAAAEPPTPEIGLRPPVPGDDVDDDVGRLSRGARRRTVGGRQVLRERIGEAAIGVVTRREQCSREEAIQRIVEGRWTDDPVAASFLGRVRPSYRLRIRAAFSSEPRFTRRTRRTIDAIYRFVETDGSDRPGVPTTEDDR